MQNFTPWFNIGLHGNPPREGWYDVWYGPDPQELDWVGRYWWDGLNWYSDQPSRFPIEFGWPEDHWRGLTDQFTSTQTQEE